MRSRGIPVLALMLAGCGAGQAPDPDPGGLRPEEAARLDRPLRRLAADRPDSVVGVLIRTAAAPDAEQRKYMEAAGLKLGAVVGDVVSGRIRAGAALHLARLPFVLRAELAPRLPIPEPPPHADSGGSTGVHPIETKSDRARGES